MLLVNLGCIRLKNIATDIIMLFEVKVEQMTSATNTHLIINYGEE
jgi:hypothetical protein